MNQRQQQTPADPCIWMQAGVVKAKMCRRAYDCNGCRFDRILRQLAEENRERLAAGGAVSGRRGTNRLLGRQTQRNARPPAPLPAPSQTAHRFSALHQRLPVQQLRIRPVLPGSIRGPRRHPTGGNEGCPWGQDPPGRLLPSGTHLGGAGLRRPGTHRAGRLCRPSAGNHGGHRPAADGQTGPAGSRGRAHASRCAQCRPAVPGQRRGHRLQPRGENRSRGRAGGPLRKRMAAHGTADPIFGKTCAACKWAWKPRPLSRRKWTGCTRPWKPNWDPWQRTAAIWPTTF